MPGSHDDFLSLLKGAPEDLDTLVVYSDWLEQEGHHDQARFLRTQHILLQLDRDASNRADLLAEIRSIAEKVPADWRMRVNRPQILNTRWRGSDSRKTAEAKGEARPKSKFIVRFLEKGILSYTTQSGTFENGTWSQAGPHVYLETNKKYAEYFGDIVGDRYIGEAKNVTGLEWSFEVKRTTGLVKPKTPRKKRTPAAPRKKVAAKTKTAKPKQSKKVAAPKRKITKIKKTQAAKKKTSK